MNLDSCVLGPRTTPRLTGPSELKPFSKRLRGLTVTLLCRTTAPISLCAVFALTPFLGIAGGLPGVDYISHETSGCPRGLPGEVVWRPPHAQSLLSLSTAPGLMSGCCRCDAGGCADHPFGSTDPQHLDPADPCLPTNGSPEVQYEISRGPGLLGLWRPHVVATLPKPRGPDPGVWALAPPPRPRDLDSQLLCAVGSRMPFGPDSASPFSGRISRCCCWFFPLLAAVLK